MRGNMLQGVGLIEWLAFPGLKIQTWGTLFLLESGEAG